ncbi:MAG: ferrous iron transport protein B [Bacteroidia bacterium]|nr:MAG: ferrous iron transport protein B [Bacteroidia bacterium]
MELSRLKNGDKGVIVKVKGYGAFRKRITEMGFVKGQVVEVIKNAPLKDPVEYKVMGYNISLRRSEARLVEVITNQTAEESIRTNVAQVIDDESLKVSAKTKGKQVKVALVGNPNSGKTTLFNFASGSKEHVGNYAGVTVEAKQAHYKHKSYDFDIIDLPGTYSLSAFSPEELYVRKFIIAEKPDIVVNVVDASNLERNLYLTAQLIDMDIKVVLALNMYDELLSKGDHFEHASCGKLMGIPMIPTVAKKGKGIGDLFDKLIEVYEDRDPIVRHIHINYGKVVEEGIVRLREKIEKNKGLADRVSPRFIAVKLLENDESTLFSLSTYSNFNEIKKTQEQEQKKIKSLLGESSETVITDSRYGFIAGALKETYKLGAKERRKITETIDAFVTHKLWGFPLFIFLLWAMFQATFTLGEYPLTWIENLIELLGASVGEAMDDGVLKSLIVDGVIGGVGGVIVFLPNILILFLFISFFEDSGYMARAAFIMDKIMHKIGLHGKSFIPLLMGFGCNVPAIMATRTIRNRNDRILTILINPFMSCSARLPVYILLLGTFFPENAGTMLLLIYFIGILLAVIIAKIFKKTILKAEEVPFVMELPPYRMPTLKATLIHMWNKAVEYLKKIGGIILVASIIIWFLGYYPKNEMLTKQHEQRKEQLRKEYDKKISSIKQDNPLKAEKIEQEKQQEIEQLSDLFQEEKYSKSYIGQIGKFIEPVLRPLGFDWKMSISILSGIAAKEIVVSTMGVLYKWGNENSEENLKQKLLENKALNPLVIFSFILFILIYFPCIAVIAVVKREIGWNWAIFVMFYSTALAWLVSFLFYQLGNLFI